MGCLAAQTAGVITRRKMGYPTVEPARKLVRFTLTGSKHRSPASLVCKHSKQTQSTALVQLSSAHALRSSATAAAWGWRKRQGAHCKRCTPYLCPACRAPCTRPAALPPWLPKPENIQRGKVRRSQLCRRLNEQLTLTNGGEDGTPGAESTCARSSAPASCRECAVPRQHAALQRPYGACGRNRRMRRL